MGEEAEHLAATGLWILTLSLPAVLLSLELNQALDTYVKPRFAGRGGAYAHQASHWMTLLWAAYATLVATVMGRRGVLVLRDVEISQVMIIEPFHPRTVCFGLTEASIRKGVLVRSRRPAYRHPVNTARGLEVKECLRAVRNK